MTLRPEEELAELLELLLPPPAAWISSAQELPLVHRRLDELVARALADEAYRRQVTADLEAALAEAGVEPERSLVEVLRQRLQSG
jgi:hypothetical protein